MQALKRLKVKSEDVDYAPPISSILKETKGGLKAALKAMRFATEDSEISNFLKKYDAIPVGDRAYLPWEAIALSAEVNLKYLLGAAQLAIAQFFGNKSRIIAISNHPAITKARVKYALMASGERDRNSLDIMVGALPSPKGPTFIGNAVFRGGGGNSAPQEDDDEPVKTFGASDDIDELFPPSSQMQERLTLVRQRQLPDGKVE